MVAPRPIKLTKEKLLAREREEHLRKAVTNYLNRQSSLGVEGRDRAGNDLAFGHGARLLGLSNDQGGAVFPYTLDERGRRRFYHNSAQGRDAFAFAAEGNEAGAADLRREAHRTLGSPLGEGASDPEVQAWASAGAEGARRLVQAQFAMERDVLMEVLGHFDDAALERLWAGERGIGAAAADAVLQAEINELKSKAAGAREAGRIEGIETGRAESGETWKRNQALAGEINQLKEDLGLKGDEVAELAAKLAASGRPSSSLETFEIGRKRGSREAGAAVGELRRQLEELERDNSSAFQSLKDEKHRADAAEAARRAAEEKAFSSMKAETRRADAAEAARAAAEEKLNAPPKPRIEEWLSAKPNFGGPLPNWTYAGTGAAGLVAAGAALSDILSRNGLQQQDPDTYAAAQMAAALPY